MLRILLLITCLFPYISFNLLDTDTQPWSMLVSIFIIIYLSVKKKIRFPKPFRYFGISLIYVLFNLFINLLKNQTNLSEGLTSLSYYISIPLIIIAVYNINPPKNFLKFFIIIYSIWLLFGLLQFYIPNITGFIVRRQTEFSGGRGVTSLAPEPTWYSRSIILFLIFSIILYYNESINKRTFFILVGLSAFQVFILSSSITGSFYFTLVIITYGFVYFKKKKQKFYYGGFLLIVLGLIFLIGLNYFQNKRVFHYLEIAMENPSALTKLGGFNMRVLNAPMAFQAGIMDSSGLGKGVGVREEGSIYNYDFFDTEISKLDNGKAHGGLVTFIYEIGLLAFIWYVGFWKIIMYNRTINKRVRYFVLISLTLILFFESSPVNPIAAYLIGYMNNIK